MAVKSDFRSLSLSVKGLRIWWTAIRPRTLGIAVAPVVLGTALAWADGSHRHWSALLAALACALLIQIGTNLHNDVIDFERGNDRPDRVGPLRVTAAGWVSARAMHRATLLCFGLSLLGAALITLLIEKPCAKVLKKMFARGKAENKA